MFVFGAQYLRGETPERKDWDRDMAAMAQMGFNTIRAWLVWGTLEPVECNIDWDYIDTFADLVEKHSLRCGYLFHMHDIEDLEVNTQ